MVRAVRTVRPRLDDLDERDDPINDAVRGDRENIATELADLFESLSGVDQGAIKGILYRKPPNGIGKYEWIEELVPIPRDMATIFAELKERFGGGDFQLRVMVSGKIRKNVDFSIVKERTPLVTPAQKDGSDMLTLFQIMNQQSQASSDRQMQMMMTMQNQSRESSQQNLTMMVTMMTAMMGNQGKPTDMIPLIAAMKEGSSSGGMKEMVETLVALKSITEPATASAFDADNIVGSVLKIAGPVAGAVGRAVSQARGAPARTEAAQPQEFQSEQLMLPQAPMEHVALPAPVSSLQPGVGRLLALIKPDVNYFFQRQHDTDLAADAVYRVIEAALDAGTLAEDDLNDMVTAYMVSPDWLGELAANGIDLRSRPDWANQFLADLVTVHAGVSEDDDHSERANGRADDPGANGQIVAARVQGDEGSPVGRQPDDAGI